MTHLLGRQDCVESLRRDLIDLQGAVLDVFSRTGPVRFPSWKFPDKLSCNLDLVSLLEQYDFVDGEEEFNQHSHIVLLELVIDRLLLLLQSFNAHAEQLKLGQKREHIQQKGPCVSIGLVVRHYWNNLIQVGNQRASPSIVSHHCTSRAAASTPLCPPQKILNGSLSCPTHRTASNIPSCLPLISTDTRNVSCQTVVSSLVPCDACAQVQSSLRETGDALVELCQSEGLPSSLQRLLVAVDDTLEQGRLTAGDVSQWSIEQRRDMGRVGKHLLEVRSTVQPLRNSLLAAEREREEFRAQLGRAQEELKRERATHQASKKQLEQRLQEVQVSREETERRLQDEHEELRRGTARSKLEEKTQVLEAQLSTTQLLFDKEKSKYQNACLSCYCTVSLCQQSLQAKQRSLLERVDALDQECEELQGQLGKKQVYYYLTIHISALCSELQQEKQRLESHVGELKDSVNQLSGEVQELAQRERLLVAFPELNPLPQGSPQSTLISLNNPVDMEQQFQANYVRIRVLEQENSTLHSSLVKLRDRAQLGASMVASKVGQMKGPRPSGSPQTPVQPEPTQGYARHPEPALFACTRRRSESSTW
uniref:Coiled-coil domain containing 157 n=1 Tax=Hucho hucho TaxID=62062 RepID=A0A4W5PF02_9TELE